MVDVSGYRSMYRDCVVTDVGNLYVVNIEIVRGEWPNSKIVIDLDVSLALERAIESLGLRSGKAVSEYADELMEYLYYNKGVPSEITVVIDEYLKHWDEFRKYASRIDFKEVIKDREEASRLAEECIEKMKMLVKMGTDLRRAIQHALYGLMDFMSEEYSPEEFSPEEIEMYFQEEFDYLIGNTHAELFENIGFDYNKYGLKVKFI